MPAELLTPSKAVPNPRLRQRNETIPPRLSLFRGFDRPLGRGFSRENLVTGLVAGAAASRGVSQNSGHRWHSFPGYRHHHAPAADRLCHRPYWWVAARLINGPLESFSRHHRDARARVANAPQRVLGSSRASVVRANGGSHALCRGYGNALVSRDSTDTGVRHVPPIYCRAALTMGSKRLHIWLKVILPAALPFIVSGMKQGWAFAWRSLMAAEIFVTILTGFGLGQLLHYGRELSAMDQVIGIMLVIVVIGLLADKILFSPVERFLHRRWGTNP